MKREDKMFSLRYLPLQIRLECGETANLPAYLGSTLHGILGWALSTQKDVYRYIYENRRLGGANQDIVNPYIIETPRPRPVYQPGDLLSFRLILLGDAIDYADKVIQSLVQVQQFGLGVGRRKFHLLDIMQGESLRPIWHSGQLDLSAARSESIEPQILKAEWCSIHLLTPMRIRRGGTLVLKLDFPTLIRNIAGRVARLTERYGGYADPEMAAQVCSLAEHVRMTSSGLYVHALNRYSTRRQESMDLSGLLGTMTFEGDLSPFTPWLYAARILHIGRNITFGCGQIEVVFA